MSWRPLGAMLGIVALLSGCGGGGGGSTTGATAGTPTPTPTPVASAGCSLRERQDWAAVQLREWYLFPDTLPAALDPTPYTTVDDYVDALTATARSQRKDRYFTYLTSIKSEDAYYDSGMTAGFGIRLSIDASNRVLISEAFEGAPAAAAGIQRGSEIIAIGTRTTDLRSVGTIIAAEGQDGITDALGPSTAGTTRVLHLSGVGGDRTITVAKDDYTLQPVSPIYGAKVIDDGGAKIGYLNLRTFISTADPQLRAAFATFRAQGVTQMIVDLRYNGGGLLSTAELMGNLLGGNRVRSEVFDYVTYRSEKSSNNNTAFFAPQPQSVSAMKIAFIGMGGTASASELVINGFVPYLHANAGLIGTNTYGKPVGQIALDRAACDDRLRVIAFALQNANRQGAYYDGLATTVEASCQAADDLTRPLGDPAEASTRQALDYLAGRSCTPITATTLAKGTASSLRVGTMDLLVPARPSAAQREMPGLF